MKTTGESTSILSLPLELRRVIILNVLKHRRPREPVLKKRVIDGRVRLQNCFDPNYPAETNIYVEKERNVRMHGNGLLRTCRRLRQDTLDLIADTLETGKVKMPFVLDIMLVKGIGFLPTWMSFPYPAKQIRKLRINVRIFVPSKGSVPLDWIRAAQHRENDYDWCKSPFTWNLWVVMVFYAMGRLSTSPANALWADPVVTPPAETIRADAASVPAYLSALAPYSVNEMFVNTNELEYSPDGKEIRRYIEYKFPQKEYYKDGYSIFGHEVFCDRDFHYSRSTREAGKIAFWQFGGAMLEAFDHLPSYYEYYPFNDEKPSMQIYLDAAAKYIKVLNQLRSVSGTGIIWGERGSRSWEYILTGPFEAAGLAKSYRIEKKKPNPDKEIMHLFTLVKWRMDAGWWDNDNYQEMCKNRY